MVYNIHQSMSSIQLTYAVFKLKPQHTTHSMEELTVTKPCDVGYFRSITKRSHDPFDEEQDALVFAFRFQGGRVAGYVIVVVSKLFERGYEAFFESNMRDALIIANHSVSSYFTGGRDCESFELPWDAVLRHKNTEAHISIESAQEAVEKEARRQLEEDAVRQGGDSKLLPLSHYVWWNEGLVLPQVHEVRLDTKDSSFPGSLHDAMNIVDQAIAAAQS